MLGGAAIAAGVSMAFGLRAQAATEGTAPHGAREGARETHDDQAQGGQPRGGVDLRLPLEPESVRLLVIGDSGTGGRQQRDVADQIVAWRQAFPFDTAIMLGDNIYGRDRPADFVRKFEQPYKALLDAGVSFHASLGNHDRPTQRNYAPFNMGGERYYTFTRGRVRFFAMDTTLMDRAQIDWLSRELAKSPEEWKICYGHHPLYSSGERHGSEMALRKAVEPLFIEHGVNVVFAGHDHFYERITPQHGILHFVCGGAAKLRRGNIRRGRMTAAGFDQDRSFMLVEFGRDEMFFQAISRTGQTVDEGKFARVRQPALALR